MEVQSTNSHTQMCARPGLGGESTSLNVSHKNKDADSILSIHDSCPRITTHIHTSCLPRLKLSDLFPHFSGVFSVLLHKLLILRDKTRSLHRHSVKHAGLSLTFTICSLTSCKCFKMYGCGRKLHIHFVFDMWSHSHILTSLNTHTCTHATHIHTHVQALTHTHTHTRTHTHTHVHNHTP